MKKLFNTYLPYFLSVALLATAGFFWVNIPNTQAAATELFSTPLFSDANLVSYFRVEGNSNDAKGSNNMTDTSTTYASTSGLFGQYAVLNGASISQKSSPTGLPSGNSDYTITGWFNQSATGRTFDFGFGTESNNSMAVLAYESPNILLYGFSNDVFVSDTVSSNAWHMVAVTYKASTKGATFYMDGSQVGTTQTLANTPTLGATFLEFGKNRPGSGFDNNTHEDDMAVFSRILTATEISNLYTGNFPASVDAIFFAGD